MNGKKRKNNKTGITGVCWDKKRKKWFAQIKINYHNKFLGYFKELSDAVKARKQAELKYFKEIFS